MLLNNIIDIMRKFKLELLADWKKIHPLSKRLASFRILGAQLKAPFKLLNTIVLWWSEGFQGGSQLFPHDAKNASLSERCLSDPCSFPPCNVTNWWLVFNKECFWSPELFNYYITSKVGQNLTIPSQELSIV